MQVKHRVRLNQSVQLLFLFAIDQLTYVAMM